MINPSQVNNWQQSSQPRLALLQLLRPNQQPGNYLPIPTPSPHGITVTNTAPMAPRQLPLYRGVHNVIIRPSLAPTSAPVDGGIKGKQRGAHIADSRPFLNPDALTFMPSITNKDMTTMSASAIVFQPNTFYSLESAPVSVPPSQLAVSPALSVSAMTTTPVVSSSSLRQDNISSAAVSYPGWNANINIPASIASSSTTINTYSTLTAPLNSSAQQVNIPNAAPYHPCQNINNTALISSSSSTARTAMKTQGETLPSSACPINSQSSSISIATDKIVLSSVSVESQTDLMGVDWDAKLCVNCKKLLCGSQASSQRVGGSGLKAAPTFLKLKDISMQHKVKYLAIKAAVFVRDSPTSLSQPLDLKDKLLNRLDKMCSHFGAESQGSLSWQDDLACSVAVNLLLEEPEYASAANNRKFLQQLKAELESQMEIAQDIMNQSTAASSISNTNQAMGAIQPTAYSTADNSPVTSSSLAANPTTELVNRNDLPDIINPQQVGNNNNNTVYAAAPTPKTETICAVDNSTSSTSTIGEINVNVPHVNPSAPNQVICPASSINDSDAIGHAQFATLQVRDSETTGSGIDNHSISSLLLPSSGENNSLSTNNALNSNFVFSSTPTLIPMMNEVIEVPNVNNPLCSNSNPQLNTSLLGNPMFTANPLVATANLFNNNLQCNVVSKELQQMQQNYMEVLKQFNDLNPQQQSIASGNLNLNSLGEVELNSDKFVSQISQSVAEFKSSDCSSSFSYPPAPPISPSLSLEDDVSIALSMSTCGQERVRHLSSSTSNSDSTDHNKSVNQKKQVHHGKQESTTHNTVGSTKKRAAPLDFRKLKSNSMENTQHSSLESCLSALYVSVSSQDINNNESSACALKHFDRLNSQSCKEEMAKSSEFKPIRRLTPLQRKRLKKSENSSGDGSLAVSATTTEKFKSVLPKTVEMEEQQLPSVQPFRDHLTHLGQNGPASNVGLATIECEWEKAKNPYISGSGDATTKTFHDHADNANFSSDSRTDSDFMKRLKSKKLLHIQPHNPSYFNNHKVEDGCSSYNPSVVVRTFRDSSIEEEGDVMKRLKSKQLLLCEEPAYSVVPTVQKQRDVDSTIVRSLGHNNQTESDSVKCFNSKNVTQNQNLWTPHDSNILDVRTLRAIGEELARNFTSPQPDECEIGKGEIAKSNLKEESPSITAAVHYDESIVTDTTLGSQTEEDIILPTLMKETCTILPSTGEGMAHSDAATNLDNQANYYHSDDSGIPYSSTLTVKDNPSSLPSQDSSSPDFCHQREEDEQSAGSHFQFQSYSDIVKQKPNHHQASSSSPHCSMNRTRIDQSQSSGISDSAVFKSEAAQDDSDSSFINPLFPASASFSISNAEEATSSDRRTWSSLFASNNAAKASNGAAKASNDAAKNRDQIKLKATTPYIDTLSCPVQKDPFELECIDEEDESDDKKDDDEETRSRNEEKFGKYGLDDFTTTPPKLKLIIAAADTGKGEAKETTDGKVEEQKKLKEESEWKLVTKKSKKAVSSQDMDVLLKDFRTEDQYRDLCEAIAEKSPGISMESVKDVLETVFMETEGLADMDDWEILEEVDVALAEMCPPPQGRKEGAGCKIKEN